MMAGPGAAFSRMHEHFRIVKVFRHALCESLIWILLSFPWAIRYAIQDVSCVAVGEEQRLRINYNVQCWKGTHLEYTSDVALKTFMLMFAVPSTILLLLFGRRNHLWEVGSREIFVVYTEGYTAPAYAWEALMFLRTALVSWGLQGSSLWKRILIMWVVMFVFITIDILWKPFDSRSRRVIAFVENWCKVNVMIVLWAGAVCRQEEDSTMPEVFAQISVDQTFAVLVLVGSNLFLLCYGARSLTFKTLSLPMQVLLEAGAYLNSRAMKVHKFLRAAAGLNPLGYYKDPATGRYIIDISRLSESERRFLVESLAETVSACLDSGDVFRTWTVENAIHEAFMRALEARAANLRAAYSRWGEMTHPASLVWRCFSVTLRPPDIPGEQAAHEANAKDGAPTANHMPGGGITVEELHAALQDVNYDVLEHHPELHREHQRHSVAVEEESEACAELTLDGLEIEDNNPWAHEEEASQVSGTLSRMPSALMSDARSEENVVREISFHVGNTRLEAELKDRLCLLQEQVMQLRRDLGKSPSPPSPSAMRASTSSEVSQM